MIPLSPRGLARYPRSKDEPSFPLPWLLKVGSSNFACCCVDACCVGNWACFVRGCVVSAVPAGVRVRDQRRRVCREPRFAGIGAEPARQVWAVAAQLSSATARRGGVLLFVLVGAVLGGVH